MARTQDLTEEPRTPWRLETDPLNPWKQPPKPPTQKEPYFPHRHSPKPSQKPKLSAFFLVLGPGQVASLLLDLGEQGRVRENSRAINACSL